MTQFGSTAKNKRNKSTKISLTCLLTTILGISVSTLLLFSRLHQATRQPPPSDNLLQRSYRKTREELDTEAYMKTGRKPRHVDSKFSERKIEGNIYEVKDSHEEDAAVRQAQKEAALKHLSDSTNTEEHRNHLPEKHAGGDSKREKHSHFLEDLRPEAEVKGIKVTSYRGDIKELDLSPRGIQAPSEKLLSHWKHAGKNPPQTQNQHQPHFQNPIQFLDYTQLSKQDTFSASWLQRRQEFLTMPLEKIMICEDAAWLAWDERPAQLRMTYDYMDFSVEHLSKWWKFLSFSNTPVAYNTIIERLIQYIKRGDQYPTSDELMLPTTLAMIAFQPYTHKKESAKHYNLTITSLAATIESIRRAQLGRVVVVGMVDNGMEITQEAFRYLAEKANVKQESNPEGLVTKIGHLEVGYARGSLEIARSKHLEKNIPRAVLYGTKQALLLGDKPVAQRAANETAYIKEWLGDDHSPQYWKYFYLTEPDTLLNARPNAIPQLKGQLDLGRIVAPHRLQPIPHESDLKGLANRFRYLNEDNGFDDKVLWEIDPSTDVCCDEHQGPDQKPGRDNYGNCGTWWYMCGFKKDYTDKSLGDDVHERLRPYQFIKLKGGTGLTLLAGNLFGRRCFPAKNTVCKLPKQ